MTISLLSSFKRKSSRQSLFRGGGGIRDILVSKYKPSRRTSPNMPRRGRSYERRIRDGRGDDTDHANNLVKIDRFTVDAMRTEVVNLLVSSGSGGKASIHVMATTLMESDAVQVMACNNEDTSNENDVQDVLSIARLSLKPGKKNSALAKALHSLVVQVGSTTQYVSSWKEAKEVLSTVVAFPSVEAWKRSKSVPSTLTEVQRYRKMIDKQMLKLTLLRQKSRSFASRKFQQLSLTKVPPLTTEESGLVVEEATSLQQQRPSVIEKMDAAHAQKLKQALKEREERTQSKALKELEEKEHAREAQEKASSLLRPLSEEEQSIVKSAMYSLGDEAEIIAEIGTDSVQRGSMHRLQPGEWLNDEVIHYFMVMLSKRDEHLSQQDPNRKRSHFFKSFFITKLLDIGNANPDLDGRYNYNNVKRWSKKVAGKDLFALDKIFFPINVGGVHWICAVAFMQLKRIQLYDSMGSQDFFYLDSIFQYLQDEHKAKKGSVMPDIGEWKLVGTTKDTPRQLNGYDCGVFTCMFADFLSTDCPLLFSQEHITQCRERIALSIMNGKALV